MPRQKKPTFTKLNDIGMCQFNPDEYPASVSSKNYPLKGERTLINGRVFALNAKDTDDRRVFVSLRSTAQMRNLAVALVTCADREDDKAAQNVAR